MPKMAVAKWHDFRELYERHFVSLETIAKLGRAKLATVKRIAERSGWQPAVHTANRLRFLLTQDVVDHLERLRGQDVDLAVEEKRARAMQLMAKTLESIDQVERRLWRTDDENKMGDHVQNRKCEPDDTSSLDEGSVDKITADLERLVRRVESQRRDEVS